MEGSTAIELGEVNFKVVEERVGDLYDVMRAIKFLAQRVEESSDHRIELAIAIRHLSIRAQDFINECDCAIEIVGGSVLQ